MGKVAFLEVSQAEEALHFKWKSDWKACLEDPNMDGVLDIYDLGVVITHLTEDVGEGTKRWGCTASKENVRRAHYQLGGIAEKAR